jgi:hypothetical protein
MRCFPLYAIAGRTDTRTSAAVPVPADPFRNIRDTLKSEPGSRPSTTSWMPYATEVVPVFCRALESVTPWIVVPDAIVVPVFSWKATSTDPAPECVICAAQRTVIFPDGGAVNDTPTGEVAPDRAVTYVVDVHVPESRGA